jgi:nicotinate-nucleotide adenylyltransferase
MMKVGLFGGTFDPIHTGHLVVAMLAKEAVRLDKVCFIPAGVPPHKRGKRITAGVHRYRMIQLAIQGYDDYEVLDRELKQDQPSYTVDTLQWYRQTFPEDEPFFIMGADMLFDLPRWYQAERVIELAEIIAVTRPGFDQAMSDHYLQQLPDEWREHIHFVDMPGLEISSTWLRERLDQGLPVTHLVPDPVIRYIKENRLYGGE